MSYLDHPLVPLHLLVWAVQTAVTTLTCVADYTSWDVSAEEKWSLGQLYLPYLALGRCTQHSINEAFLISSHL